MPATVLSNPPVPPCLEILDQLKSEAVIQARTAAHVTLTVPRVVFQKALEESRFPEGRSTMRLARLPSGTISVDPHHDRVEVRSDQHPGLKGEALNIKPGGALLRLQVVCGPDEAETYRPIGIAFLQQNPVPRLPDERVGNDVFVRDHVRLGPEYLEFSDLFGHPQRQYDGVYEFSLVIQRASDGAIGVIDPPITHDN